MSTSPDETPLEPESIPDAAVRRRRRLRRLGFLLAMWLVLAVGQEVGFRLLFPSLETPAFNRVHYQQMASSHPTLGRAMERGLVYDRLWIESRPDGFSTVHNLNAHGFRGPDFRVRPSPSRRRILVIGDSVVEGQGVADSETITAEWSRLLAAEGTPAEVVNLGVIAASFPHLWVLTRDAVGLLAPSDVVVSLYVNDLPAPAMRPFDLNPVKAFPSPPASRAPRVVDLIEMAVYEKPIHRRWFHPAVRFFAPVPDGTNPWSDGRPRPASLREDLFEDMKAARINPWLYYQAQDVAGQLTHDFAASGSPGEYLKQMQALCRAAGARMFVVYVPFCGVVHPRYAAPLVAMGMDPETASALAVDPRYRAQNRITADVCRELQLPLADATTALEALEAAGTPAYWAYDTHPNPQGYAAIAGRIHEVWKATPLETSTVAPETGAAP